MDQVDEVAQVAPEPVQLPRDQGVAGPHGFEARLQPGPVVALARGVVLVEVARVHASAEQGVFGPSNDGVSPVVIGGNSWAEAWAEDEFGRPLYVIGSGYDGMRQRELALRFGINLVMYVLTGNYKSDQVHVPALLERLRDEDLTR